MVGTTFFCSLRNLGGNKQGLRQSTKSRTRKEHESETNSIAKRGQGTASLVGFGATPQLLVGRSTQRKKSTKGAGSEASLPVTLRVRRRASKLLFPQDSVKNHSSTPPWHSYLKNKNGYCGGFRPHTVPAFLMQSRENYSAAGAKKEICVAPVMASADSIVMGAVSTLSVAKEPS